MSFRFYLLTKDLYKNIMTGNDAYIKTFHEHDNGYVIRQFFVVITQSVTEKGTIVEIHEIRNKPQSKTMNEYVILVSKNNDE
jgi:hypothetical protein